MNMEFVCSILNGILLSLREQQLEDMVDVENRNRLLVKHFHQKEQYSLMFIEIPDSEVFERNSFQNLRKRDI